MDKKTERILKEIFDSRLKMIDEAIRYYEERINSRGITAMEQRDYKKHQWWEKIKKTTIQDLKKEIWNKMNLKPYWKE